MTFSTLGTDTTTHQPVYLYKASRTQGSYIVGLQGMGKSGLLENLIIDDIKQGTGVCVLDPHGELVDHVIARLPGKAEEEKVIYLDLTVKDLFFGLNLFDCVDPTDDGEITITVNQVTHVFEKAFGISMEATPRIYDYLFNSAYTLIANPGYTMIDIPLLFNDACRQKLLLNVTSTEVTKFWNDYKQLPQQEQSSQSREILRRLNDLSHFPLRSIVGQSRSTIDLLRIVDGGKILLVKLDRLREQATSLIGSIIVALILNASAARRSHKQFHLYADEFQRFATEDFATLLEEARKAGIGVTMAHQNRAQLELSEKQADAELKKRTLNVGNIVVFRIPTDAHELAGQFDTTPLPSEMRLEQVQTPVTDLLGWLYSGRSHPEVPVNMFMNKMLRPMIEAMRQHLNFPQGQEAQKAYDYLNHWFYKIMEESVKYAEEIKSGNPSKNALIAQEWLDHPDPHLDNAVCYLSIDPLPVETFLTMVKYCEYRYKCRDIIHILECAKVGEITDVLSSHIPELKIQMQEALEAFPDYFGVKHDSMVVWKIEHPIWTYQQGQSATSNYNYISRADQMASLEQFSKELKAFLNGIFKSPILEPSGHYVEKPVPRTFADMQNDIANELVRLPKFTAWVKLTNDKDIVVEHIVTTMKPGTGLYGKVLQDRLDSIQQQNLRDCYIRERVKIEEDIVKRQDQCSQSLQMQAHQSPPPRRGQIPICQNCGSQNRQDSKYCSQCGTKI